MAIIACPQCQKKLQLPEGFAGKQVQCPGCKTIFAPEPAGETPAPSAPPPPISDYHDDEDRPPGRSADEDAFEDRPRRPRHDDEHDRGRTLRRRDDDDHDDRPRRRGRNDDDDDDRPRRRPYDDDGDYRSRRHREPHRGALILTLGILSLLVCGPILGPIAWILGNVDMAKIRRGTMDPSGEGITQAGRIIGMVATILSIVVIVIYAFIIVIALSARRW